MNRLIRPLLLCLMMLTCGDTLAQSEDAPNTQVNSWSPKPVDDELMSKVINGNLFVPNQRREIRPEPGEGESQPQTPDNVPPPIEREPENPDRRYRLVGTSADTGQWLAFIENTETREVRRVAVDEQVASGSVTHIDYNRIEYTADGEAVSVLIGRDLTGELPQATLNERLDSLFMPESTASGGSEAFGVSDGESSNANRSTAPASDADAQRAEILRRLRERRERESQ